APGSVAQVRVGQRLVASRSVAGLERQQAARERARVDQEVMSALSEAGYPRVASDANVREGPVISILLVFLLASTALYGPQAAALVELFPARIRYTALSVPYNIGTGWVGGLLPVSAFAWVAATGNIYSGLQYPLVFTVIGIVATLWLFTETAGRPLADSSDEGAAAAMASGLMRSRQWGLKWTR